MNKANIEEIYKLSPMQEGMLFHSIDAEGDGAYHQQFHCVLEGELDATAFERAWQRVVARHGILRTAFFWKEAKNPLQLVCRKVDLSLRQLDWRLFSEAEKERRLAALLDEDRRQPFDLGAPPLMRLALARLDERTHHFLWSHHHLLLDGWSLPVVLGEVFAAYAAERTGQELDWRPARPYRDYVGWLQKQDAKAAEAAWRQTLGGFSATRLAGSQDAAMVEHGELRSRLSSADSQALDEMARRERVTVATVVQGAWAAILARTVGEDRVVFGATVSGRPSDLPGVETMVGLFINTVPVAVELEPGQAWGSWLRGIQQRRSAVRRFDHTPLARVQRWAGAARGEGLFDSLVVFENFPVARSGAASEHGLALHRVDSVEVTNYPLTVVAKPGDRLALAMAYQSPAPGEVGARRFLAQLERVLRQIAARPEARVGEIELLAPAERHQLLVEWNSRPMHRPAFRQPIHRRFEALVAEQGERLAVASAETELSYRQLDRRANRLAHHLRSLGVGPEVPVPLLMERSAEMVVALLAVLKAGGGYVPLDPANPPRRLAYLLEDAGRGLEAPVVLTQERFAPRLAELGVGARTVILDRDPPEISDFPSTPPEVADHLDHLAYMIYTSGSTGQPKGVQVTHRTLLHFLSVRRSYHRHEPFHAFLLLYPLAFDSSVAGIFWAFAEGGALILADERFQENMPALVDLLERYEVSHLDSLPSLHNALLDIAEPYQLRSVRNVVVGGEACLPSVVRRHLEVMPQAGLYNEYGPTEATVWTTVQHCNPVADEEVVSIGRPTAGAQTHLVDRRLRPVPLAGQGEIVIGGDGVARGYHGQPRRTAEKYVPDPFSSIPGSRLYRTGDLARQRPGGRLDFLGRFGQQIKIRGFRVEIGEIESALDEHPDLRESAVVLRRAEDDGLPGKGGRAGDKVLVAYLAARSEASEMDIDAVRAFVAERVPSYAVPSVFVLLEALPQNANGKVDRVALAQRPITRSTARERTASAPPRTATEKTLAAIWAEILGVESPGLHDNFFELGGDSILSIQIVGRANRQGVRITTRQLFEHPTLAALAAVAGQAAEVRAEQGAVVGELPLTPIQRWFFEQQYPGEHHYNQAVLLEARPGLAPASLRRATAALLFHHDVLRLRFERRADGEVRQILAPPVGRSAEDPQALAAAPLVHFDLSALAATRRTATLERLAGQLQASLDLEHGPLLRLALFTMGEGELGAGEGDRLMVVVHHLAVDGVSWRILLEDLQNAYAAALAGRPITLQAKTTSFKHWSERLAAWVEGGGLAGEIDFWQRTLAAAPPALPDEGGETVGGRPGPRRPGTRRPGTRRPGTVATSARHTVTLDTATTEALLATVPRAYETRIDEVLLTALVEALAPWSGERRMLVDLEGHGRDELFDEVDLSRTLGWFTTLYPVLLDLDAIPAGEVGPALKTIKEQVRRVPGQGLGFGLLRHGAVTPPALEGAPEAEVQLNYLGQLDQALGQDSPLVPAVESSGRARDPRGALDHPLALDAAVSGGALKVVWTYDRRRFRASTIDTLAQRFVATLEAVVEHCGEGRALGRTPSDFPLAPLDQGWIDQAFDPHRPIDDIYPLSPMQEGMFFHTLSDPDSAMYFEQVGWSLEGELDIPCFRHTWDRLLDRHPILRTAFVWKGLGAPVQVVYGRVDLPWEALDWRDLGEAEQKTRKREFLADDRRRGFDFASAPLLRVTVIRLAERRWEVVLSHHHALMDGWSFPLLLGELFDTYEALSKGREPEERERSRPFRDYIAWLDRQDLETAETYWRRTLAGLTEPTTLAVDHRRELDLDPLEMFAERYLHLTPEVTRRLEAWARSHHVTLNTAVQGAWALLLGRYSGAGDSVFGITVAGRPAELPGVESIVGLFINTLPVRIRFTEHDRLAAWLPRVQLEQVEQRGYEYTPLTQIRRWSEVPGAVPLFETLLVFENYPLYESLPEVARAALAVHDVLSFQRASFPLTVVAVPGERLRFRLTYDRRRFDGTTVTRLAGHFRRLLEGLSEQEDRPLGELSLLSPAERHQALVEWSQAARPGEAPTPIDALFRRQVEIAPEAPALVFERDDQVVRLSYGELHRRAHRLGHRLRSSGVGPEVAVGVCCRRSADFVVAVMAVIEAGGFFVPLDPTYPEDRLAAMVEIAGCAVLLVEGEGQVGGFDTSNLETLVLARLADELVAEHHPADGVELRSGTRPESALYTIFTSGSTGRPKGVLVEHRHLYSHLQGILERLDLPERATIPTVSTISADVGHTPIFGALTSGHCLHVVNEEVATSPDGLSRYIERHQLDFLKIVPSHVNTLRQNTREGEFRLPGSRMLVGGETFFWRDARELQALAPEIGIYNHYGPTETTVGVMTYRLRLEDEGQLPMKTSWLPLGRPLPGARVRLADRRGAPVPVGVAGEVVIGGDSVSRGYLGRPAATAERFVPDPFASRPGERIYRSGDLARTLPDGQIEFLGRVDYQVKVRGFRVELEEIQGALRELSALEAAVVVARPSSTGDSILVAYVVPAGSAPPAAADLRDELARGLPSHMVPTSFVFLDALPLNQNGKVDRRALPDPEALEVVDDDVVAPRNAVEAVVARIWAEALGLERVGVEADFFDLGGHSLTAIRILSRIEEAFSVQVSPARFFEAETVARLAEVIEGLRLGAGEDASRAPLDLAAKAVLDPVITAAPGLEPPAEAATTILLTGATGFVGIHLLDELLRRTEARVVCLVRASDEAEGLSRLLRTLESYKLFDQDLLDDHLVGRIVPLPGDLGSPRLGLGERQFETLATEIDAIYHNGALVNFAYPYTALERPNVLGSEEILRLATREKLKPVHFVSTISVFDSLAFADRARVDEGDDPAEPQGLPHGYVQSKWVAERLMLLARGRGVPVSIYRLGRVSWHRRTGAWPESDFVQRLMRSCVQLGGAPELGQTTSLVPVDWVAEALVTLASGGRHLGRDFHLANPEPVPWDQLVGWIEDRGYSLARWSFPRWQGELLGSIHHSTDNALYPLAAFAAGGAAETRPGADSQQTDQQMRQLERQLTVVACDKTLATLAPLGLTFPEIDDAVVDTYFRFARQRGFLPSTQIERPGIDRSGTDRPETERPGIDRPGIESREIHQTEDDLARAGV